MTDILNHPFAPTILAVLRAHKPKPFSRAEGRKGRQPSPLTPINLREKMQNNIDAQPKKHKFRAEKLLRELNSNQLMDLTRKVAAAASLQHDNLKLDPVSATARILEARA